MDNKLGSKFQEKKTWGFWTRHIQTMIDSFVLPPLCSHIRKANINGERAGKKERNLIGALYTETKWPMANGDAYAINSSWLKGEKRK